ncbi:MAG: YdhR family protein [Chloroflexota bacterium]
MITAHVQFQLPSPITVDQAKEIMSGTAPNYLGMDGLIRKYYLLSEDGTSAGGIYLWESRAHAEKVYTAEWEIHIRNKYGAAPSVTYFETPVVVDNLTGEIISGA